MGDVKRYDLDCQCSGSTMKWMENGDYVEWDDYAALRAENQRLKNKCMDLSLNVMDYEKNKLLARLIRERGIVDDDLWEVLLRERNEAQAEVERLTAALAQNPIAHEQGGNS